MKDQYKTKKQLIEELEVLRNQLVKPKKTKANRKRAEEALRGNEETFRALAENANDGIFVAVGKGVQAYANKRASEITGYSVAELLKSSIKDLAHPDELKEIMERYRKRLAGEPVPPQYETVIIRKDGKSLPIELTAAKTVWQGQPAGLVIIRDIAERKHVEVALKESEQRFRAIFEGAIDGILLADIETKKFHAANKIICEMLGYSLKEIKNLGVVDIHPKEALPFAMEQFDKLVRGEITKTTELPVKRKDDSVFYAEISTVLLKVDAGTYLMGTFRDITERKRVEEALRESEKKYRAVVDISPDGIAIASKGRHVFANQSLARIFGVSDPDKLLGKPIMDYIHPDYRKIVRERIESQTKRGVLAPLIEEKMMRADGTVIHTEVAAAPLEYQGEQAVLAIIRDITERKQAEEVLRESQERFKIAAQSASDLIWDWDIPTGRLQWFGAIDELLGYAPGKFPRTIEAWEKVIHPDDHDRVMAALDHHLKEQAPYNEEYRVRLKDGAYRYWTDRGTVLRDSEGNPLKMVGACTDITERKQAGTALRESEERFRKLVETMKVGLASIDEKGVLTYVNEYFSKMLGYTIDEMIGRSTLDFYYDEESRKTQEEIFAKRRAGLRDPTPYEVTWRKKDGQKVYSILSPTPIFDANGRYTGSFAIHTDITERKRAEEALRESEERFRLAFENANTGVCLVDLEGNLTKVNDKMCEIFGYTKEELERMTVNDIAHPEDMDKSPMFIQRTLRGETDRGTFEKRYLHKKGHVVTCQVSSSLVRNADGSPLCFISHVHDITERKRAEEESEVLREQFRQSQKMEAIGRLAGGIAHDFNNLLTIIKGYSQLSLIELKEDSPLRKNIEHIHGATDRAANLVRQLLAFSRRQILEMKVLDLNAILTNLDNMLRRVIGEDIELITVLAEDLGRVKTDPGWIEQAIMNLVVNSRDAMASGGKLTIETGNADLDEAYTCSHVGVEPGRYVMLSVSDTGVGITPEVMERLFEPFFSTKEKDKGTGLGLSTVYGIVKQSDGDIWVYSEPGKGATFKIYLPRVDEPLEERREKVLGDELLRGSETILLVEDEENVRKLALRVLERQGYKVLSARDGNDALLICEQHKGRIHLILTDVVMPGMSGHELAKRLKSLHPEIKVLYMSGYTDDTIVLHGVLVEGVNYIQKPFTVDALTKKIREVLEQ